MDANPLLASELLAERFGPVTRAGPKPVLPAGDGGPDTELSCARRRRELNDAMGDPHSRRRRAERERHAS